MAGTPGKMGMEGDGSFAINATFGIISGVAFDAKSNIYISDMLYHNIRVIFRNGVVRTLAGKACPLDSSGKPVNAWHMTVLFIHLSASIIDYAFVFSHFHYCI